MVERRSSTRAPVEGPVCLRIGERIFEGRARDIGLEGLFVEIDPAPYCVNDTVEVDLALQWPVPWREYRLTALVVQTTARGVGLMFSEVAPELQHGLTRLLRDHRHEAPPQAPPREQPVLGLAPLKLRAG